MAAPPAAVAWQAMPDFALVWRYGGGGAMIDIPLAMGMTIAQTATGGGSSAFKS